jgi:hypothetical protein
MDYLDLPTVLTVAAALAVSSFAYLQIASEPEARAEVKIDTKSVPKNGAVHESGAPVDTDPALHTTLVEESR